MEQMGMSYQLNLLSRRLLILFPEVVLLALAVIVVVVIFVSGPFLMLFVAVPLSLLVKLVGRPLVPAAPFLS